MDEIGEREGPAGAGENGTLESVPQAWRVRALAAAGAASLVIVAAVMFLLGPRWPVLASRPVGLGLLIVVNLGAMALLTEGVAVGASGFKVTRVWGQRNVRFAEVTGAEVVEGRTLVLRLSGGRECRVPLNAFKNGAEVARAILNGLKAANPAAAIAGDARGWLD